MMHDISLYHGLQRLHTAYNGFLSTHIRETALLKYNANKTVLDSQWQAELEPVMRDLYWYPLRNGLDDLPTSEARLRAYLTRRYQNRDAILALLLLLQRYQVKAFNLGGQLGLDFLGVDLEFKLSSPRYLEKMNRFAEQLVTPGADVNVMDTTIDDLTKKIIEFRELDTSILLAIGAYIASRAYRRTVLIERYERPRQSAEGQQAVYENNNVRMIYFDTNGTGCKEICTPLQGETAEVGNIPYRLRLPQHDGCDCVYRPANEGWAEPGMFWTGYDPDMPR